MPFELTAQLKTFICRPGALRLKSFKILICSYECSFLAKASMEYLEQKFQGALEKDVFIKHQNTLRNQGSSLLC